ncbi:MAG: sodium-dependent bicarbonate transport family permease [Sphingomonadales bacterium 32-68-7]|nr:MAG: sodium-dependent bicarbonate transport family permease [Sphingomonadales bacterium 12-68-11]OYX08953.1 MAG: sodium-dependent bicarbonate transport family permease [Sphingomonadales bacterium 32-68-7]
MIADTLTSPVVLFFALGFIAALLRSDLAVPEAVAKALSIYLMAAIGLKGGVAVADAGFTPLLGYAALAGIVLSLLLPFLAFALLQRVGRLGRIDAAAVAAHYGSVSLVTFGAASDMLAAAGVPAAGFMVAVLALMETPAIISGLYIARRGAAGNRLRGQWRELLANGPVLLLVGAFGIGLIAGRDGFAPISPVFESGYRGILCLFLLDMGLVAARRIVQSRSLTARLALLAVILPLINGAIGTVLGTLIGLDVGSAAALGILAASASYIAVPAAMRMALPEADPGIYLSMALGITFPFNVILGIPLFAALAQVLS